MKHILESITNIETFMKNVSEAFFNKDIEKQSAVIRQIEVIGEAVRNLPSDFKREYPGVTWKEIIGMRDKLMHHYFGVNLKTVLKTIKDDLPLLKKQIQQIKTDLEEGKK